MKYKRLGRSAVVVSDICMGTMTFGVQTDDFQFGLRVDLVVVLRVDNGP